jgi:GTP cyclohydrolase I
MTHPAITHFPTAINLEKLRVSKEKRVELISEKMRDILEILGLDANDPSLISTPEMVARMYVEEIFSGLDPANFPEIVLQEQSLPQGEMVLVKNITLTSFCEHHFVPMNGIAHVAYIPKRHIIGLSKIHRIVRYFGRRPQLQERLTAQIADSLSILLQTEDVAVYTSASHHCVISRGVEDTPSETDMHVLRGVFQSEKGIREEFFSCICHR